MGFFLQANFLSDLHTICIFLVEGTAFHTKSTQCSSKWQTVSTFTSSHPPSYNIVSKINYKASDKIHKTELDTQKSQHMEYSVIFPFVVSPIFDHLLNSIWSVFEQYLTTMWSVFDQYLTTSRKYLISIWSVFDWQGGQYLISIWSFCLPLC